MLEDLRRALRMDSPSPKLGDTNLRKLSKGMRSSKKSRLSVQSSLETRSVQDEPLGTRSASLSTLLPMNGMSPRVDKLQSLEAKMANIEVSLGWRRRREALLETLPRAARDLVRELDSLHQTVRDKEVIIQTLKGQVTNLGGVATNSDGQNGVMSENEKRSLQERLNKVQSEIEAKKIAVKNLKLTLEKIDITENIDVRIRAAELEFELEREELNILNLSEESAVLTGRLDASNNPVPKTGSEADIKRKLFSDLIESTDCSDESAVTLLILKVSYTPGNPPFHVHDSPLGGCVVNWAAEDTGLRKGDRILEVNEEVVLNKDIASITKYMSSSGMLSLVVSRPTVRSESTISWNRLEKLLEDKVKENKELVGRLDKALRERDSHNADNTRLKHRITYLEDQVNDMQESMLENEETPPPSSGSSTDNAPTQPGATIIQVYQRGPLALAVPTNYQKPPIGSSPEDIDPSRPVRYPRSENYKVHNSNENLNMNHKGITRDDQESYPKKNEDSDGIIPYEDIANYSDYKSETREDSSSHSTPTKSNSTENAPKPNVMERKAAYKPLFTSRYRALPKENLNTSSSSSDIIPGDQVYGYTGHHPKENKVCEPPMRQQYRPVASRRPTKELQMQKTHRDPPHLPREPMTRHIYPGRERPVKRARPIPPKKPERLSLHRATSLQNVDDVRPCSRLSSTSSMAYPETIAGDYRENSHPHSRHTYRNGGTSSEVSYPMSSHKKPETRRQKYLGDMIRGAPPGPPFSLIEENKGRLRVTVEKNRYSNRLEQEARKENIYSDHPGLNHSNNDNIEWC